MNNIIVRCVPLPHSVRGTTVTDEDGNYNIYINSLLSYEARCDAYRHEFNHLKNNDFYNDDELSVIEERADKALKERPNQN